MPKTTATKNESTNQPPRGASITRSVSLQMLTATPRLAPLKQEMYTEQLQPMRSPPKYYGFPVYQANPSSEEEETDYCYSDQPSSSSSMSDSLVRNRPKETEQASSSRTDPPSFSSVMEERAKPNAIPRIQNYSNCRKFSGDAAFAHTFTTAPPTRKQGRIVSLPAKPKSEFDFSFSSILPADLPKTIGLENTNTPMASTYKPENMREQYITGSRASQTAGPSRSSTPSGFRSSTSMSNARPASTLRRRSSMMNSITNLLGDRKPSSSGTNKSSDS